MSKQKDREEFIAIMAQEGVPLDVARGLMRHGATLTRIAELQCSSEAADRDQVKCPGDYAPGQCLCRDYGSFDMVPNRIAPPRPNYPHGTVPRINVKEARIQALVEKLCAPYGIKPAFSGDPRGAVLKLAMPSGRTNDWGKEGVCVP